MADRVGPDPRSHQLPGLPPGRQVRVDREDRVQMG